MPYEPRTDLRYDPAPDAPDYPPSSARLTLAKLLLELSEHVSALEILNRLENEDDEDSEIWYLSGWAWWLLGEARAASEPSDEEENQAECWSEAKLCLENYLKVSTVVEPPRTCWAMGADLRGLWLFAAGRARARGERPGAAGPRERAAG